MATFLSSEWLDELDQAACASQALQSATADISLTVQQVVTGGNGGNRDTNESTAYHVVVDHGSVRIRPGHADHFDVSFTQDRETATAVGRGDLSAQAAFMLGKLRVGGNVSLLMAHQATFAGIDDVFAEVRDRTTY